MTNGPADRGRIWILEDSALEAEVARRALSVSQDVELFSDGSVVLERAASGPLPDAIVLDWQLPGINGIEVCKVLRASHDAMSLPLLMLTSSGLKADTIEALAAGANDYVTKPYDIAELVARVSALVRTSHLQRAQIRRARQLALAADIGEAITKGKSLEEVATRCARAVAMHLDAPAAEVWTQRNGRLELLASTSWSQDQATPREPAAGSALPERVIRDVADSQKAVITDDAAEIVRLGVAQPGVHGFAVVPLVERGETRGVVAFSSRAPVGDALHALAAIADLLALGMTRTRMEEERVAILDSERNSRAEAEAANRSKDDFLAMVSHELRTPLSAITGWTSMLLGGGLDAPKTKRALEVIERSARSQAQLIDDLLDISRIVSGSLRVDVGSVDVPSLAQMAIESVRLAAEAKGVQLVSKVDVAAGHVSGDSDRIQQIIWNLLSNAIKFTPNGGTVELDLRRDARGIVIDIIDSGQGIAPQFLPYVFDRFKQADQTSTRAKGGLGLGLAIVKHLVELHCGTVQAYSEGLGKGARFNVVLPALKTELDATKHPTSSTFAAARSSVERQLEVEGLRVLVVDDEDDARELIRMLLESCKITVITASNAADGFQVVKGGQIDVLLSDIAMPVEDGLSFIKRVRALTSEEGGRIPAIALTAYARLEDRSRALRAGFDVHVAKPVEPSELLAVLTSVTNR